MRTFTFLKSLFVALFLFTATLLNAQTTYTLVTNVSELESGSNYLIVAKSGNIYYTFGTRFTTGNGGYNPLDITASVQSSGNTINLVPSTDLANGPFQIKIEGNSTDGWSLYDAVNISSQYGGYLGPKTATQNANALIFYNDPVNFNITISNNVATIKAIDETTYGDRIYLKMLINSTDQTKYFRCYKLTTTDTYDIYLYKSSVTPTVDPNLIVSNPIVTNSDVSISYTIQNYENGKVKYILNNENSVCTTGNPILLNSLTDGDYTITLELVDGTCSSLNPQVIRTKTFHVGEISVVITPIADIQQGTVSGTVTIEGIVTFIQYNYNSGAQEGYYVQDAVTPWSGIYIYDNQNQPVIGNTVRITGSISEYYDFTEITPTSFMITDITSSVPAPMEVNCQTANAEDYESCYIKLCGFDITASGANGNYTVSDASGTFTVNKSRQIADAGATLAIGSTYSAKGIVNYRDVFRLMPDVLKEGTDCIFTAIDVDKLTNTEIYPNPATTQITISTENRIDNVVIINSIGQVVVELTNVENGKIISTGILNAGLYLVKFTTDSQTKYEKLVIK